MLVDLSLFVELVETATLLSTSSKTCLAAFVIASYVEEDAAIDDLVISTNPSLPAGAFLENSETESVTNLLNSDELISDNSAKFFVSLELTS